MNNDDFLLEQLERSQRDQTRRRRDHRSRRRQIYILSATFALLALTLGLPSLISHSSLGRSLLVDALDEYGLEAEVNSMRIGWITPLRVNGLNVKGTAGTKATIEQIDMDLTVPDLISGRIGEGETILRGVALACLVEDNGTSIEKDLQPFLKPSESSSNQSTIVNLQNVSIALTDTATAQTWQISQSNAACKILPTGFEVTFEGVLSEPSGGGGALQGVASYEQPAGTPVTKWNVDVESESLPLSIVSLLRRRFPVAAASIPTRISGDATGGVTVQGESDGSVQATIRDLRIRNLLASDEGSRAWQNSLATLSGELMLAGDRIVGRNLRATTDFATTTIDGAFSRNFSLVGTHDNPLRWLDAIDGTATAEINLAALDQSLPGLLPLREGAELVDGKIVARVDSSIANRGQRRSNLDIRTNAIRASAQGRPVVIDPVTLIATVSNQQGELRAEKFQWQSAFGSAIGQGDLRQGQADFDVDFGRLTALLRPIVAMSETTFAGTARGNLGWNSANDSIWRLGGTANASNLIVTLPSGEVLRQPGLQASIEAVGRWGQRSLDELSTATFGLKSDGLDFSAGLTEAIAQPSATTPLPFRIRGNGSLQALHELLGPWLPADLHDAGGRFTLSAATTLTSQQANLTSATMEWVEPHVAYGERHFSQPNVKVHFDGDYGWPSGRFYARSMTVAGDAFSMAAKGTASADEIDMTVKWRAKLERIQGSVQQRVAAAPTGPFRQVAYRSTEPVKTNDWLLMGDCEGSVVVTKLDHRIKLDTELTGKQLALIQPPKSSARSQTVGPPRVGSPALGTSRVVWAEPNLQVNGVLQYDSKSGYVDADAMQLAGDWFATTLSGQVAWDDQQQTVQLSGPAKLKMDEVAIRLSELAGMEIRAEGVHQTPLSLSIQRGEDNYMHLDVAGNLGWERVAIAGVTLGRATIPLQMNETSVRIAPASIPVDQGRLNIAGQVNYRPGPVWIQIDPSVSAEQIYLTSEMTDRWMKYLAPLLANSTQVEGIIGAQIDEGFIVLDQPEQSRVRGRLNITGVQMTAGPLAQQLISGVDILRSLGSTAAVGPPAPQRRTLVSMPSQTVQFAVNDGVVSHDRLFFDVDRAQIVTSGQVAMDGRLNLVAQVPLDTRWLGRDLQGLAGQTISLPIDGTLSRPSLDSTGLRQLVGQLGAQAVQNTAENYLQQQLNRGIDRLFGR